MEADQGLLIWANTLFIVYSTTRCNPFIKFLATFLLALSCRAGENYILASQFLCFSLGDILLEIANLNVSLFFFGLGKLIKLYSIGAFHTIWIVVLTARLCVKRGVKPIYVYVGVHLIHFYWIIHHGNMGYIVSNILFILSDILIGIDLLGYYLPYYEYISYPLYWCSNLCSMFSSRDLISISIAAISR